MRVSKETAVLLKEAGYDVPCEYGICEDGAIVKRDSTIWSDWIIAPAPTLHEAADWLRSKGVHVGTECSDGIWSCSGQKCPDGGMLFDLPFCYPTHDIAYEAGIVHGLKYKQ